MAIIGKLLKKTNQINYKRVVKRGKSHTTQRETLLKLKGGCLFYLVLTDFLSFH